MESPFTCPHCDVTITEADAWWDELRSSGRCPACANDRRRRRRLLTAAVLVLLPIGGCYLNSARPWDRNLRLIRQPRAAIREALLKETPAGSPRADVRGAIVRHGWTLSRYSMAKDSITAKLGEDSGFMLSMGAWATWTFNDRDQLTDVTVQKQLDGP
jgi:hypothetical protein